jgi:3-oxoacyl-[acyl-carrier protein] reductase
MFDLTGRKALLTGATGGIGEEIAKALHARGAIVGLHGTRREKLEQLAAELGDRTQIFTANLSDRAAVRELAQTAEKELGGIDILVNNAGITNDGLMMRMSDEDWDKVIDINLNAAFVLTRAAAEAQSYGLIDQVLDSRKIKPQAISR